MTADTHPDETGPHELVDPEARRDVLLRASGSTEADAAPRVTLSEGTGGATRIDIADTAAVRPGPPQLEGEPEPDE
jgi:hypothetical protein